MNRPFEDIGGVARRNDRARGRVAKNVFGAGRAEVPAHVAQAPPVVGGHHAGSAAGP